MPSVLLSFFCLLVAAPAAADKEDEFHAFTDTVYVHGVYPGPVQTEVVTPDYLTDIFEKDGLAVAHRGVALTADLHMDGFRREQILLTIDGERQHAACPMRMDGLLGRINPLEMATVDLSPGFDGAQTGLAGAVEFRRRAPSWRRRVRVLGGGAGGAGGHAELAVAIEARGVRVSARRLEMAVPEDGDGRDYGDLYGYLQQPDARLNEIALTIDRGGWRVTCGAGATRDVAFPYLKMDESSSDHLSFSLAHGRHRAYVNRTEHLMDNVMRAPAATMVTDATTMTAGLVGPGYELYLRDWDADNEIGPLRNHLMPDVRRLGAVCSRRVSLGGSLDLRLRLGAVRTRAGDDAALDLNRELHSDAERTANSWPYGIRLGYERALAAGEVRLAVEHVAEPPEMSALFIAVRKPAGKPHWVGDPGLDDPRRTSLRGRWRRGGLSVDAHVDRVDDHVDLARHVVGGVKYLSFANHDAWLAGIALRTRRGPVEAGLVWNWGERADAGTPLAEIRPLTFDLALTSPRWRAGRFGETGARLHWTVAAEQSRVDSTSGEIPSDGWHRLDLTIDLARAPLRIWLQGLNLTDETYSDHLAYRRDPFAAGDRVFAPGRTVVLRIGADF